MSDLRERLAPLFACRCEPAWTDRHLHAPDCIEELQEDVVERVAAWLRDEADKLAAAGEADGTVTPLMQAEAISHLADAIDPHPERTTP